MDPMKTLRRLSRRSRKGLFGITFWDLNKISQVATLSYTLYEILFEDVLAWKLNYGVSIKYLKTIWKNCLGFELFKKGLKGKVSKKETVGQIDDFIKSVPVGTHDIKIVAIALMAHGDENDWWVSSSSDDIIWSISYAPYHM